MFYMNHEREIENERIRAEHLDYLTGLAEDHFDMSEWWPTDEDLAARDAYREAQEDEEYFEYDPDLRRDLLREV